MTIFPVTNQLIENNLATFKWYTMKIANVYERKYIL